MIETHAHRPGADIGSFSRIGLSRDRDYVVENLSMLVASGMTVLESLDGIRAEVRSGAMQRLLDHMRADIESGYPLWRALEGSGVFPAYTISLVRIGEGSGRLAANLRLVSEQEKKQRIFRSRIRSAMMYPIFVLGLTLIIGIGIAWFILPKLAGVFSQLHIKLPLITKVLIAVGSFLGTWGYIVIPVFVIAFAGATYLLFFAPRTKYIGQSALFAIPAIRRLILETELARFGYLLGTLLAAGIPVVQALSSLRDSAEFPPYRRLYDSLVHGIEDGNSFEKSFKAYPRLRRLMPTPVQQLIMSAERSGNLSGALLDISARYEAESETTTKDLTVILEPILLVVVWLGVVAVALAVILPIYSLVGNLNTN